MLFLREWLVPAELPRAPGPAESSPIWPGQLDPVSDETRAAAGLSQPELWLRYFALGGMGSPGEVESYFFSGVAPSAHEHDVLAQALNERFSEIGRACLVRYAEAGR